MTTERASLEGTSMAEGLSMSNHPDIVSLRERYDRAAETPQAWTVEGLTLMGGIYAAISPWVIGFHTRAPGLTVSNLVVGLTIAALAVGLGTMYSRMHGLSWIIPLMGVWLIITPFIIHGTPLSIGLVLSNVITGGCLVLLGMGDSGIAMLKPGAHR